MHNLRVRIHNLVIPATLIAFFGIGSSMAFAQASSDDGYDQRLEEVTVTAQKREESLSEVRELRPVLTIKTEEMARIRFAH